MKALSSLLKNLCKFHVENSKFIQISEKIILLYIKSNENEAFKITVLDLIRFIDEVKAEQMNEAMINLDKGYTYRTSLEKLKKDIFDSLIKTQFLQVKDSDKNCLIDLLTGLCHSNNSIVVNSIKQFDTLLDESKSDYENLLTKFNFILSSKLKKFNEKEDVLSAIFMMKNLNKLMNSNDEFKREIKQFYIKLSANKDYKNIYSAEMFNLIEKFIFEHCICEKQNHENEVLNMLILIVSLNNNNKLNKVIEKNNFISKIIKYKASSIDYIESFASYLCSNSNKNMNSKIFFQNFIQIYLDNNQLSLEIIYKVSYFLNYR